MGDHGRRTIQSRCVKRNTGKIPVSGEKRQGVHIQDSRREQFSSVKVKDMKPFIRNLLRMSVYQLKYMDSVPDSAVCNEAVKLAQKKGFYTLKNFVNGVLRNIARKLD